LPVIPAKAGSSGDASINDVHVDVASRLDPRFGGMTSSLSAACRVPGRDEIDGERRGERVGGALQ
jgi:hypothetical protein